MFVEQLLDAKDVTIGGKSFKVSRIPTLKAMKIYGDIVRSVGDYGKLGMTMLPLDIAQELFSYCAAKTESGGWTVLDTNDAVNTYLPNLFDGIQLQYAMCQENFGFFLDGKLTAFLRPKAESSQSK